MVVTQTAAWGLSYGPYVADYSRYLTRKLRLRECLLSRNEHLTPGGEIDYEVLSVRLGKLNRGRRTAGG
jgi:hypothetical protein